MAAFPVLGRGIYRDKPQRGRQMSSMYVQFYVRAANELHVGRDLAGTWWTVGKLGSYGGAQARRDAIKIALDTSATSFGGDARIVVHRLNGDVDRVITRTDQEPSAQFFQDAVS